VPARSTPAPGYPSKEETRRPGSGYGNGLSSTDRTTVKMAVLAPRQMASVRMTAAA
jgi:hypothetical protein